MNNATVNVTKTGNGNLIRIWDEDNELNVQLTTATCVELARVRFTGQDAHGMGILVASAWAKSNA